MLISVIIPVYNREEFIYLSVKSVVEQTYTKWELIIVDDNSTDDTFFSILPLLNNRKISYYFLKKNYGVSFARNFGIKRARGEFICFLDSDDIWLPQKLEKQLDYMIKNNCKICQTEEKWLRNNRFVNPKKKHKKIAGDIFKKSLEMCMVSPSAVMIHKDIFNNIGLFDETMRACEDYDLWLRISLKYQIGLLEEMLIIKRGGHDSQLSKMSGLDKYRIYSLMKLLKSGNIDTIKKEQILSVMLKKIDIYLNGCIKRKKLKEAEYYKNLLINFKNYGTKKDSNR